VSLLMYIISPLLVYVGSELRIKVLRFKNFKDGASRPLLHILRYYYETIYDSTLCAVQ